MQKKILLICLFSIFILGNIFGQICGDVNEDSNVNIVDALAIAKYLVGKQPSTFNPYLADVDNNGKINVIDALKVALFVVGKIDTLNCPPIPTPTPSPSPTPSPTPRPTLGPGILPNPGFETGTTSGWYAFGSCSLTATTSVVHTGSYAGYVTGRTSTWMGPAANLVGIMQNWGNYKVSIWALMDNAESATLNATIKMTDDNGTSYNQIASKTVTNTDWVEFSGNFAVRAAGSISDIVLYVEGAPVDINYYVDDAVVTLESITTPPPTTGPTPDPGILPNPGFENGTTSGWYAFGSCSLVTNTSVVHTGSYAGLVTGRTSTWMGPAANLVNLVQNGAVYHVSIWAKLDNAASASLNATIKMADDNGEHYNQVASRTVTNTDWIEFSGNYTLNATGAITDIVLYLEGAPVDVSFFVDDAVVTLVSAPTPPPTPEPNLVPNPGFETGTTDSWYPFGTAQLAVSTAQVHSGSYSGLVTGRTANWEGPAVNMLNLLTNGTSYKVSIWAMLDNTASSPLNATIKLTDDDGEHYTQVVTETVTNTEWTEFAGYYTMNSTGTVTELALYVEGAAPDVSYYVDDASMIVSALPTPPPAADHPNPGFEDGTLTGWYPFGGCTMEVVTTPVHAGNYAAYISNRTEVWMGSGLDLKNVCENGKTYRISLWAMLGNVETGSLAATMKLADDNGNHYNQVTSVAVTNTGWSQLNGFYTVNATGPITELVMYLETEIGTTYYVDDASIKVEMIAPEGLLSNPGFEMGTLGWSPFGSCSVEASSAVVRTGSFAGYVSNRTETWNGAAIDLMPIVETGKTYLFSAWVRLANTASDTVKVSMKKTDDDGDSYTNIASAAATDTAWSLLSAVYTVEGTGPITALTVYIEGAAAGISYYVDDADLVENTLPLVNQAAINTEVKHQTMEGLGAALAWYEGWLVNHPYKDQVYDVIFKDLGLDILRLRNDYNHQTEFTTLYEEIVPRANQSLGKPITVLMSSWTPPAAYKSNDLLERGTLKKNADGSYMYDEFAGYWYDSLVAYKDKGVNIDFISIQNEPNFEADWETCRLDPTESAESAGYGIALDHVYNKLQTLADVPRILGPEPLGIQYTQLKAYMDNLNPDQLYGIAHHLYNGGNNGFPDTFIPDFNAARDAYSSKPIIQTEYSFQDAFNTAWLIHNSFAEENASAYIYWELVWDNLTTLVDLDNYTVDQSEWESPVGYTIHPQYYAFKHFSYFIDKGYKRVDTASGTEDIRISAYTSPGESQLSVIILNTSFGQGSLVLDLGSYTSSASAVYRTSATEQCQLIGAYDGTAGITLPPRSIVTVVFTK